MKHQYLKDFVFGAIDGAVTTFAVVAGVAGAHLTLGIVIVLGVANLVGDGFSIAVSNFLATRAEQDIRRKAKKEDPFPSSPLRAGLATFCAFLIVGAVPLIPFFFKLLIPESFFNPFSWSAVATGVGFFIIGALKSRFVGRKWLTTGLQTFLMGGSAAALAYLVGMFLGHLAK